MISGFQFRDSPRSLRPEPRALPPNGLRSLLASLRGRQVAVLVNGQRHVGKVITLDPLLLVGADGAATSLSYETIHSIQF